MILLIILLVLLFGGGGGYYGYSRWGMGGGMGVVGTVLLILLIVYLVGGLRCPRPHPTEPNGICKCTGTGGLVGVARRSNCVKGEDIHEAKLEGQSQSQVSRNEG